MIDDLFAEQTMTAARDRIANPGPPPAPERKFSVWGALTALPRGITSAVAEVGASGAELLDAFGQVGGAYPEALGYSPDGGSEARRQADAARDKLMRDGVSMNTDVGDSLRAAGRIYRPDPATSSTAEQLLYGFARGATKITAGAVAAGPLGVAGAGLEEANTQADELAQQGVPFGPRVAAGAVQGAGLGLAALPLVGSSLKATAALYVAGGPGGFMAQQALTREILRNSGQNQVAEQFDPFDPVGLAVSALLPAAFVAHGLHAQRIQRAVQSLPEELPRDAGAPVPSAAEPMPSRLSPVAEAVRAYPTEVVDAAMVVRLAEQVRGTEAGAELLSRPADLAAAVERARGMETQLAALEAQRADLLSTAGNLAEPGAIREARTELRLMEQTRVDLSDQALRALAKVVQAQDGVSYKAALSKATKDAEGRAADWTARQQRLLSFIEGNAKAQQATQSLHQLDQQIADLRAQAESTQPVVQWARALEAARQQTQFDRFHEATAAAPEATPAPADGMVRLYHGGSPEGVTGPLWFTTDRRDANGWASRGAGMRVWYVDVPKATADSILGGDLPNGIVPLSRVELPPELANQRRPLVDATTQATRTNREATPAAAGAAAAAEAVPGAGPAADAQAGLGAGGAPRNAATADTIARVERLVAERPSLVVETDTNGASRTAAEVMDQAKREAIEGSDTELGTADAPLVKAAVECFLSTWSR